MGQITNLTAADGRLPEALTALEESGFRTGEYLADRPAIEAIGDDETVQFVLTNRKQGIAIQRDTTRHVLPDSRYQTVAAVTDRRVVVLVGKMSGDRQFAVDISEISDVGTKTNGRAGLLTIEHADGTIWGIHTGTGGLSEVATYLRDASDGCGTGGRVGAASRSIRGVFEATVGSAKSFERDQMAELIPAIAASAPGEGETDAADAAGASAGASASSGGRNAEMAERPDTPDTETAIDDILQALAKTDWRARGAKPESPFDLLAEREDELVGVVVHCPSDDRLDRSSIERCDAITGAAGTDTVLLATTADIRETDARLAADLGVRLRNVETLSDATDPPTIEAVTEMVQKVLTKGGWSVRPGTTGPFDMLADSGEELMGVVVHSPEDGTVRRSIERCDAITGAAGTDTVLLATTGTVRNADERLADELGVRLVESDSLAQRHVTEIDPD